MNAAPQGADGDKARRAPSLSVSRACQAIATAVIFAMVALAAHGVKLASPAASEHGLSVHTAPWEAPVQPMRLLAIPAAGCPAIPGERRRPLDGPQSGPEPGPEGVSQPGAADWAIAAGAEPVGTAWGLEAEAKRAHTTRGMPRCSRAPPA